MNALQQFIQARPFGFITDADLPELIKLHRLCQVLVRCGACRFTCAAQDVAHLEKCIRAGGDYIRDIAITAREIEQAPSWKPEPDLAALNRAADAKLKTAERTIKAARLATHFDEADCGGVFDGNQVWSDTEIGGAPGF